MKAIKYLKQFKEIEEEIKDLELELQLWRDKACSCTITMSGEKTPGGGSGDMHKMESAIVEIIDIEGRLANRISQLRLKEMEISENLSLMPNRKEKSILHKIYIQGMDLYEVAEVYNRSRRWVESYQGIALAHFQTIIDEKGL